MSKKALVAYFTWSNGNTERIAKALQQALQADILRVLSAHFDEYADCHEIRLRRDLNRLFIEIFLEFDGDKRMRQVQQSISNIKRDLENRITGSEVLIIPTTHEGADS